MAAVEIIVDALTSELRIALVRDGVLIDLDIHRPSSSHPIGTVLLGRVKKVAPELHGAFVDIGEPEDGFLPFADTISGPRWPGENGGPKRAA